MPQNVFPRLIVIRAFAFDLDETLTDCEPQHEAATRAWLHELGVPTSAVRDVFHDAVGARTRDLVAACARAAGVAMPLDALLAMRHRHFEAALVARPAVPLAGAREAVAACAARGPVALVTSGHRADVESTLASLGLRGAFAALVTGDDVEQPKPHPEPYAAAARALGVAAGEVLAFEDSKRGVGAARAAGCRVVAVPNHTTPREAVAEADVVLASLRETLPLEALLARLTGDGGRRG